MFKKLLSIIAGIVFGFWIVRWVASIKESTLNFRSEYSKDFYSFLHGYVYLRFQYIYLKISDFVGDILLKIGVKKSPAHNFIKRNHHFKIVKNEEAKKMISINQPISINKPEKVVPYKSIREIILEYPQDIALLACACRSLNNNGCGADDVCLYLGNVLVDFVVSHGTWGARKINQKEALDVLEKERKRGHIQTIWFKDFFGGRLYSICSCCQCCCLGLKAYQEHGIPLLSSSGYVSSVNKEKCNNCGLCVDRCYFSAIRKIAGDLYVDEELCLGCALCQDICPEEAIELKREPSKPEPIETYIY